MHRIIIPTQARIGRTLPPVAGLLPEFGPAASVVRATMLNLLVLLRFEPADPAGCAPEHAIEAYAARVREAGGSLVDRESDQLLVCLADMRWGLQSLRNLLSQARRESFVVRAAIVQAVLARCDSPDGSLAFTARTLETLLRLAAHVDRQQVGITPKLLSLIELAAPEYADLFVRLADPIGALPGEASAQPVLVMAG
ncbi:MAG: hypothetical protein M9885_02675 [Burkholderiaceae bacterium]|nr:hypothetical protein [Burkholderiaceae bacterium]